MQQLLTAAEMARWGQYCVQLTQCGWRTWESAEAFLAFSPFLAQRLSVTEVWEWAEVGVALARRAARLIGLGQARGRLGAHLPTGKRARMTPCAARPGA